MSKKDYANWTKEELIRELEKYKKQKKYGIVWEDKPEQVALMCKEKLPVLTEDKEKEIITDKDKPINILIEGDNYHALSVLNYTHKGKIDVIYIDPPYNTGNEDFMYNDKIVDREDAYRHSKWLSFMEKRLKLAKSLLNDKGVMFISIDDNEMAQLKILCDEIFGEENYLSNIKIKVKAPAGVGQESYLFDICEYVLVYARKAKNAINAKPQVEETINAETTDTYNKILKTFGDEKEIKKIEGKIVGEITVYKHNSFKIENIPSEKRNMNIYYKCFERIFRTTNPQGGLLKKVIPQIPKEGLISIEYIPSKGRSKGKKFRYYFLNGALIVWLKDSAIKDKKTREVKKIVKNTNLWLENFHQGIAGEGNVNFKSKKPIKLIKRLIELNPNKNAIILDFFAGSGTTGEAVLEINKDDGGNRKFILCTNNNDEKGGHKICTDICYPRIRNAIFGYRNKKGLGGNLKYFKTEFVDAEPTDKNKKKLVDKSTEMLCLKEDCFDFVLEGKNFRIYKNNKETYLGIIYDDDGIEPFKKEAKKLNKKFVVYVFSLDDSAKEEEFEDLENVELKPIPAAILNVYKRIFKGL